MCSLETLWVSGEGPGLAALLSVLSVLRVARCMQESHPDCETIGRRRESKAMAGETVGKKHSSTCWEGVGGYTPRRPGREARQVTRPDGMSEARWRDGTVADRGGGALCWEQAASHCSAPSWVCRPERMPWAVRSPVP